MNTHDWLMNLPIGDAQSSCRVVEVSFNQGSRKDYFRNNTLHQFEKGELVVVEGVSGIDIGEVSLTGEIVRIQLKKKGVAENNVEMKKLLRRPSEQELQRMKDNKAREREALVRARAILRQLGLDMKLSEVEIQADGRKATFFYIADDRVDFRELIKIYASEFKVKVEMRQIGARQEAAKVGGLGSCGRELCCSTWLTDFRSVNTTAARYQNLSINQSKLSGQCGRLKCCLNYELDIYLDALQFFPEYAETLQIARGTAMLVKKDIFKSLMWYTLPDSHKQYPLTIERVRKIKQLNAQGVIPEELEAVDLTSTKVREAEMAFVDLVGQISLRTLERNDRKRKQNRQQQNKGGGQAQQQGGGKSGGMKPQGQQQANRRPGQQQGGSKSGGPKPQGQQQRPPRNQGGQGQQGQKPGGDRRPPRDKK